MKKEIMIVGLHHFDSLNNKDLRFIDMNIRSEKRQTEIIELIELLSAFQPTKIALEIDQERNEEINQDYRNYLNEQFNLNNNEKHQIGFRLAKKLNHPQLYCVNWNQTQPHIPVLFQWISENPCALWDELQSIADSEITKRQAHLSTHSAKEFIQWLNQKEQTSHDHQLYVKLALIEDHHSSLGAQWVGQYWYYRNLLIYKNLTQLFDTENERVLLLIGSAHVHLLTQFFKENGEFQMIDSAQFLEQ